MDYEQSTIDQEFRSLAMLADVRVQELERGASTSRSADQHDEALGDFAVYRFLHARPFMISRETLLDELRWFLHSEPHVPANAYSVDRFTSSRYSLIKRLIDRFELSAVRGMVPGLA